MNDSRITAYAVGELEPAEREAFERELATSADLQRELAETIAVAEALPATLSESGDTLDDERRRALVAKFSEPKKRSVVRVWIPALAACLVTALALVSLTSKRKTSAHLAARETLRGVDLMSAPEVTTKSGGKTVKVKILRETSPTTTAAPAEAQVSAPTAKQSKLETSSLAMADGAAAQARQAPGSPGLDVAARRPVAEAVAQPSAVNNLPAGSHSELLAGVDSAWEMPMAEPAPQQQAVAALRSQGIADSSSRLAAAPPVQNMAAGNIVGGLDKAGQGQGGFGFGGEATGQMADQMQGSAWSTRSRQDKDFNTESYDSITPNEFLDAKDTPLSTFSIDVDTASYANVRRFLNAGAFPPAGAVRLEELINYFPYSYPQPGGDAPFSITTDVTTAPWNPEHLLARIALKGRELDSDKLPPSNLVFLIDVSGSMQPEDKLPLLKRALRGLIDRLSPRDSVAIVVYAGSSGLVLSPTDGADKAKILDALDRLDAGGSTNGAGGIQLAYDTARKNLLEEGNNRVILCTDGDFNVGVTSQSELVKLIERERKSGVFLSVLGFGTGNVKDSTMEKLADKGNGNYAYIDSPAEARKVLVEQMGATLFTIAKDVKVQVEFNPATVAGYRLIGYENRLLAKEDFNDDTKDAGEIGAGHTVTALYEIMPAGQKLPGNRDVDPLKYQAPRGKTEASGDLFTVKLRYKAPDGDTSKLIEKSVGNKITEFDATPVDFRFATAVAGFGMKLRGGENDASMDWSTIQKIARGSLGDDPGSYRAEFLTLIEKARHLPDPQ